MVADGERGTGLSGETVRRWEIGRSAPTATYRKHLVTVLGRSASQLGLLSAEDMALRPSTEPAVPVVEDNGLIAGVVAETVRQVLRVVGRDSSTTSRRILVRGMLDTTAAAHEPPMATTLLFTGNTSQATTRRTLSRPTVAEFARITAAQQRLYFTSDAEAMLGAVLPHLRLGINLLVMPQLDSAEVRALARSVALTALLAARIAFFDLSDLDLAKDCFTLATRAVDVSGDHALSAAVRAHQAFVPGFAGNAHDARALLDAAHAHARRAPSPRLRSWLHCVSAEIAARTGDPKESLVQIRQAEQALSTHGDDPTWLDFFDEPRWAAFAGQAYLLAGKAAQAATHLQQALDHLHQDGHKQRSVLLLDLATAQAPTDAAEATATAHHAFDTLTAAPYAAAVTRFPQLVAALRATPFAGEIRDRIHTSPWPTGQGSSSTAGSN